jgi:hypothetical protein
MHQGMPDDATNKAAAAAKLKMDSAQNKYEWNLKRIERGVNSTPGLTEEGAGQIMNWYYQRIGAEMPQPEQPAAAAAEQPTMIPGHERGGGAPPVVKTAEEAWKLTTGA